MEFGDPFVPAFPSDESGHVELPEQWMAPFAGSNGAGSSTAVEATPEETAQPEAEHADAPTPVERPWMTATETVAVQAPAADEEPMALQPAAAPDEPVAATSPTAPVAVDGNGGLDRARALAGELVGTLQDLQAALTGGEGERAALLAERAEMQQRIAALEVEAEHKRQFKETLTTGMSATLSDADVKAMQEITDALTADPDRLTVLFSVVQQAGKLATVVSVFTTLRNMANDL